MLGLISLGFKILSGICALVLLIGLVKPWVVLWWEYQQYRLKVIQLYGSVGLVSYIVSHILDYIERIN